MRLTPDNLPELLRGDLIEIDLGVYRDSDEMEMGEAEEMGRTEGVVENGEMTAEVRSTDA